MSLVGFPKITNNYYHKYLLGKTYTIYRKKYQVKYINISSIIFFRIDMVILGETYSQILLLLIKWFSRIYEQKINCLIIDKMKHLRLYNTVN